jgi:hypothetical protein
MALLNPPDILPEAMRFIVRAMLALPGGEVDREELMSLVAPAGLAETMTAMGRDSEDVDDEEERSDTKSGGQKIAKDSLTALQTLGIVQILRDTVVFAKLPDSWKKPLDVRADRFSMHLLQQVLTTADPTVPIGDSQGVMDLVHSLAVLHYAENPLQPFTGLEPGKGKKDPSRHFAEYQTNLFGDDRSNWPIPNREQWLPLGRWAPYLGLARTVGQRGLIADASIALSQGLSDLAAGDYPIDEFVSRCATAVPFLDGGPFHFADEQSGSGEHGVLSPGLSVSLRQLEAGGLLSFDRKSDIGTRSIRVTSDNSNDIVVSHVKWAGVTSRGGKR